MARITIQDEARTLEDVEEIRAFLQPFGIWYEHWDVEGRIDRDASSEEILEAYKQEIERLKKSGGYVTADVIDIQGEMPGLEALLAKFSKEHTHTEDEVRFIVKGRGVFHIHGEVDGQDRVFAIQVDSGDLINVPAGTKHWFDLCEERVIRAIRLFQDQAGWTPHYVQEGVHAQYTPVCFGKSYIP